MSAYEGDPRVELNDDGTAVVPGVPGVEDWTVREEHHVWIAHNPLQGYLHSEVNADFAATFRSRDEVLARLLGDPQTGAGA